MESGKYADSQNKRMKKRLLPGESDSIMFVDQCSRCKGPLGDLKYSTTINKEKIYLYFMWDCSIFHKSRFGATSKPYSKSISIETLESRHSNDHIEVTYNIYDTN